MVRELRITYQAEDGDPFEAIPMLVAEAFIEAGFKVIDVKDEVRAVRKIRD